MVVDYKSRKNEVLASYDRAEALVTDFRIYAKKIGLPDPMERLQNLLKDIRSKAGRVKEDRFNIMVAGESKSGKSTFINAYLGVELLPMDVKQCTSAIVEIKWGNDKIRELKFKMQELYAKDLEEFALATIARLVLRALKKDTDVAGTIRNYFITVSDDTIMIVKRMLKGDNLRDDLDYTDEDGITNRNRMARGLAPLDSETGKPIELHHLGQKEDSPLVELTEKEHRTGEYEDGKKNQSLWHDNTKETEVHGEGNTWDQERKAHWKARIENTKE